MSSLFMIGTTAEDLVALDELEVPLPDPQPEFIKYRKKDRLGNATMKGRGPNTILWGFPLLEVEQNTQLGSLQSTDPIFIQSPNIDDEPMIYEVMMNFTDPREAGGHKPGFRGYRDGLSVEFIVLSVVEGS